jgi:hypothetical protein
VEKWATPLVMRCGSWTDDSVLGTHDTLVLGQRYVMSSGAVDGLIDSQYDHLVFFFLVICLIAPEG